MLKTEKRCPGCGETKALDQFQRDSGRRDGCQSRCRVCKAAQKKEYRTTHPLTVEQQARAKARHEEWRGRNREELRDVRRSRMALDPLFRQAYEAAMERSLGKIAERRALLHALKQELGCCACETRRRRLDFHHVDPETKAFGIAKATGYSPTRIVEEMRKCIVLCTTCHASHHAGSLALEAEIVESARVSLDAAIDLAFSA